MEACKRVYYTDGYKYQLAESCTYQTTIVNNPVWTDFISLDKFGLLLVHKGYAWDGPSGLTFDTKNSMRGSLIHDALCQLINEGLLSKKHQPYVDTLLYDICREDGMSQPRAWLWYRAVRNYDKSGLKPYTSKPVHTAP